MEHHVLVKDLKWKISTTRWLLSSRILLLHLPTILISICHSRAAQNITLLTTVEKHGYLISSINESGVCDWGTNAFALWHDRSSVDKCQRDPRYSTPTSKQFPTYKNPYNPLPPIKTNHKTIKIQNQHSNTQQSTLTSTLAYTINLDPNYHCNRLSGVTAYTHASYKCGNKTTVQIPPCSP